MISGFFEIELWQTEEKKSTYEILSQTLEVLNGRRRWLIFHSFEIAVYFTLFVIGFSISFQNGISCVVLFIYAIF